MSDRQTTAARLAEIERQLHQYYPADQRLDVALHVLVQEVPWLLDTIHHLTDQLEQERAQTATLLAGLRMRGLIDPLAPEGAGGQGKQ